MSTMIFDTSKIVIVVTADRSQTGKTLTAQFLAGKLGLPSVATSTVVTELLAKKLGIAADAIYESRKIDANAYRGDLVALGREMVDNKIYASVICFQRGARIIEGIRWMPDLEACKEICELNGYELIHIHIAISPEMVEQLKLKPDFSDADRFRAAASIVINNFGSKDELLESLETTYKLLITPQ